MENFAKMPMAMLAYGTKSYVTDDEVIVYAHLVLERPFRMQTKLNTNIDLINGHIKLDKTNPSRGKKRIHGALEGLSRKGYISISYNDEKLKNNSFLIIEFYLVDDKFTVKTTDNYQTVFSGYAQIHYEDYLKADFDGRNIKVLMHTVYRGNIDYKISNSEWANVLQVTERTVTRDKEHWSNFVTETKGKKYIDELGKPRQEPSTYRVGEEENIIRISPKKDDKAKQGTDNNIKNCTDKRFIENPNLFISRSLLSKNDMYLWLSTDCEVAKAQGQKRFDMISNTSNGRDMVADWKQQAQAMIKKEEERVHAKKVSETYHKENMESFSLSDFSNVQPEYQSHRIESDISEFLNN